jgi:hypothetical protein
MWGGYESKAADGISGCTGPEMFRQSTAGQASPGHDDSVDDECEHDRVAAAFGLKVRVDAGTPPAFHPATASKYEQASGGAFHQSAKAREDGAGNDVPE